MKAAFISASMLADPPMLASYLTHLFEEAGDSTVELTLLGFNERLGPVPMWLDDREVRGAT